MSAGDETAIEVVTIEALDGIEAEVVAVEQIHNDDPLVGMLAGDVESGTVLIVASAT